MAGVWPRDLGNAGMNLACAAADVEIKATTGPWCPLACAWCVRGASRSRSEGLGPEPHHHSRCDGASNSQARSTRIFESEIKVISMETTFSAARDTHARTVFMIRARGGSHVLRSRQNRDGARRGGRLDRPAAPCSITPLKGLNVMSV
jgi:hypothetical protein